MSRYLGLIGRPDHGPGGGWSSTRSRLLGATVSRHDLGASENVYRVAGIGLKDAGPLMGGTAVSQTVVFSDSYGLGHSDDFLRQIGPETGEAASKTFVGKAPADRTRFGQPFGSGMRGESCCLDVAPPRRAEVIITYEETGSCVPPRTAKQSTDQDRGPYTTSFKSRLRWSGALSRHTTILFEAVPCIFAALFSLPC